MFEWFHGQIKFQMRFLPVSLEILLRNSQVPPSFWNNHHAEKKNPLRENSPSYITVYVFFYEGNEGIMCAVMSLSSLKEFYLQNISKISVNLNE